MSLQIVVMFCTIVSILDKKLKLTVTIVCLAEIAIEQDTVECLLRSCDRHHDLCSMMKWHYLP
jgi:hypothetical protein